MKKVLSLVFTAAIGGAMTLAGHTLLVKQEKPQNNTQKLVQHTLTPVNYTNNFASTPVDIDFTAAAEKTVNAVVHVMNTTNYKQPTSIYDLFYGNGSGQPRIGSGSGVIISPDGHIITNHHVIEDAAEISITLNNNKIYKAELVGSDKKTDIALLKVEAEEDLPYIAFANSDNTKIGEWVLAVGNPYNLTSTVTAGIISAKARDLNGDSEIQSFLQTDAAVNPGNSGGALVNTNGELVGINTAISSKTGSYVGYSFAVPSNIARKIVEDIMEFGDVQEGILGISGDALNAMNADQLEIDETQGFYVAGVEENSGASRAGIKPGDIIKKLDQVEISNFSDLKGYLKAKRPNDVVKVSVLRNGQYKLIPVTLSKSVIRKAQFLGMELQNLDGTDKKRLNLDEGVKVISNTNRTLYRNLGIRKGYVIKSLNGQQIENISDIINFKEKYGENALENISKLTLVNNKGEEERYIFQ
ncbi:MAG: trypsin-like peptidase domain-containing protein [Flavobacteriaceae bacterium]|nr:trypsin-like peptidase domain-containing protein [Flavobacteriaceae bacterium]